MFTYYRKTSPLDGIIRNVSIFLMFYRHVDYCHDVPVKNS